MVRRGILLFVVGIVVLISCNTEKKMEDQGAYIESIETYRTTRLERLKAPDGWLNLAGLLWLKEGENTLGSDSTNTIVFPEKAESNLGEIILDGDKVIFNPNKELDIRVNDEVVESKELITDVKDKPDMVKHGDFGWFIIKREDRYGIRLRDYNSPLLSQLDSIPAYEINPDWKVEATFKELEEKRKVNVQTVIGTEEEYTVSGILEFNINEKKYTLTPFDTKDGFFIIFADETSQNETYPAGRFLYANAPDKRGQVEIDFNKAYNPPCAFTPYATCPLPPRDNILAVAVKAGEKNVHVYEH